MVQQMGDISRVLIKGDVKEFEAERGLSGTERPRRTRGAARADSDSPPPPPKSGAMAAVMDFLSDDDD